MHGRGKYVKIWKMTIGWKTTGLDGKTRKKEAGKLGNC